MIIFKGPEKIYNCRLFSSQAGIIIIIKKNRKIASSDIFTLFSGQFYNLLYIYQYLQFNMDTLWLGL